MQFITSCVCIDVYSKSHIKAVEETGDGGSSDIKGMQIYQDAKQPTMVNCVGSMLDIQSHCDDSV